MDVNGILWWQDIVAEPNILCSKLFTTLILQILWTFQLYIYTSLVLKKCLRSKKPRKGAMRSLPKKPNFCILNSFPAKPLNHPLDCFCKFTGSNPRGLRGCHAFWLWARSIPYVSRNVDQHVSFLVSVIHEMWVGGRSIPPWSSMGRSSWVSRMSQFRPKHHQNKWFGTFPESVIHATCHMIL